MIQQTTECNPIQSNSNPIQSNLKSEWRGPAADSRRYFEPFAVCFYFNFRAGENHNNINKKQTRKRASLVSSLEIHFHFHHFLGPVNRSITIRFDSMALDPSSAIMQPWRHCPTLKAPSVSNYPSILHWKLNCVENCFDIVQKQFQAKLLMFSYFKKCLKFECLTLGFTRLPSNFEKFQGLQSPFNFIWNIKLCWELSWYYSEKISYEIMDIFIF